MSKQTTIEYLLSANSRKFVTGVDKAKDGMAAFNKVTGNGGRVVASMRNQLLQLAGAAGALQTLAAANRIMIDASSAGYNLEASLKAANRQFDVGPADQWQGAIKRLSGELQIYSNTALQNAAAKTVDMTKRLGMSSEQMEKIISLTGDLSAGKFTLENGVERVTAALRGEAEASEALGLTLNENYVKAWHEAHNQHGIVWKDLSDLEKAQVRYNVLLEQAGPLQGRAAESVNTYAGALALIKKEITDSIANNEELVAAMSEVGTVLRENAGEIGSMVSALATGAAGIIEFVANNREMIASVGKWAVLFMAGFKVLSLLATGFQGVNAAMTVMTGTKLLPWFTQLIGGATSSGIAVKALAVGFGKLSLTVGAFYAAYKLGNWLSMRKEIQGVADAMKDLEDNRKLQADVSSEIGDKVGMPGASYDDLMQAEKDGVIRQDKETGEWSRVAEKDKGVLGATNPPVENPTTPRSTKIGKNPVPGDEGYEGSEAYQSWKAITGAGLTVDAPDEGMSKAELAEFYRDQKSQSGKDNTQSQRAIDQARSQELNERINESWSKVESGETNGLENIKRQLQGAYGKHELSDLRMEDSRSGSSESSDPVKTVRLEFPGGRLSGGQSDIDALLGLLEQEGLRA